MKKLGIYIHIPFCKNKCYYCDFLSFTSPIKMHDIYINALIKEILSYKGVYNDYTIDTIYIGGGTPSIIKENLILKLLDIIYNIFTVDSKVEITIEINPASACKRKFKTYLKSGINRISFGLQSAVDDELSLLGRIHTYKEFYENYYTARDIGFKNISIDLISAIPRQKLDDLAYTLDKVTSLKPEHISAYSLIIEEGTHFYDKYIKGDNKKDLLSEELDRDIYKFTNTYLKSKGYKRYEISNYSLDGYQSKHNLKYWTNEEYIGLGLGASSYINKTRYNNTKNFDKYIIHSNNKCLIENYELLSKRELISEYIFLGLRTSYGINKTKFKNTFSIDIEEIHGDTIAKLKKESLLIELDNCLILTEFGIDVSNYVFEKFI